MPIKEYVLALAVALIWGFNFVVIRWGIEDVHPAMMTILRFLLTAIPMVFFIKKPDIAMRHVAIYGILFGTGVWGLVNLAVSLGMPAGMASLWLQLSPFLTVAVAVALLGESLDRQQMSGMLIALIGFLSICLFKSSSYSYVALVLVVLSGVFWSICNVMIKLTKPKDVVSFVVWSSLFVPIPVVFLSMGYGAITGADLSPFWQLPSVKGWISIGFQAFVVTLFGYGVWTHLIGRYGLAKVAPFSLLVPISGLFFGWILYGETLSLTELTGSVLVLLGLVLLNIRFKSG